MRFGIPAARELRLGNTLVGARLEEKRQKAVFAVRREHTIPAGGLRGSAGEIRNAYYVAALGSRATAALPASDRSTSITAQTSRLKASERKVELERAVGRRRGIARPISIFAPSGRRTQPS